MNIIQDLHVWTDYSFICEKNKIPDLLIGGITKHLNVSISKVNTCGGFPGPNPNYATVCLMINPQKVIWPRHQTKLYLQRTINIINRLINIYNPTLIFFTELQALAGFSMINKQSICQLKRYICFRYKYSMK